jgi:hypothetical protein
MNPTNMPFVNQSDRASLHFAVVPGVIKVIIGRPYWKFTEEATMAVIKSDGPTGQMSVLNFAWLSRANTPSHRPIIHSRS